MHLRHLSAVRSRREAVEVLVVVRVAIAVRVVAMIASALSSLRR